MPTESQPVRMLYVGNSFTARNDVPGMVAELAACKGTVVEHRLISAGGASLRRHWNGGAARAAIEAGGLDYVVLQEQSTLPVKNSARFHDNVREFAPVVSAAGATLVLYQTWARKHAPETQELLSGSYDQIGAELGATVVRAGAAWEAFLKQYAEPVLHDKDGSHPTLAGSYLAACCFYITLFGGDPRAAETSVALAPGDREKLATVAIRVAGRSDTS